ncbi:MAG: hypothetical protein GQ552_06610 [Flavobacteriaceae bacterium]|nr:hypothetical protein [Flavobacteriaceae bacterium]
MKNLMFGFGLLVCALGFAQNNNVSGNILDGEFNSEPLAFAKISIKNSNQIVDSDIHGNYVLSLDPGKYTFVYEFIGYESIEINNVVISKEKVKLKEVILNAKK